jgi:hypothetical protein
VIGYYKIPPESVYMSLPDTFGVMDEGNILKQMRCAFKNQGIGYHYFWECVRGWYLVFLLSVTKTFISICRQSISTMASQPSLVLYFSGNIYLSLLREEIHMLLRLIILAPSRMDIGD